MSAPLPKESVDAVVSEVAKGLKGQFATTEQADTLQKSMNELSGKVDKAVASISTRENIVDDPNRGYKSIGEQLVDIAYACRPDTGGINGFAPERKEKFLKSQAVEKGPSTPTGANLDQGNSVGWLLAPTFSNDVSRKTFETNDLVSLFNRVPIEGESLTITRPNDLTRSNGITGGYLAYWKSEVEQFTGTRAQLRRITLTPKELYAYSVVSDKALRNIPALNATVASDLSEAIRYRVNQAVIRGDGVGKPLGILNAPALITQAATGSQAADTVTQANLANMRRRLLASSWSNFVVLANQDIQAQLDLLVTVVRNNADTENVGGFTTSLYNADRDTIMGRPIIREEHCSTLGDVGDILFVDPRGYYIGTRGTLQTDMSMHLRFDWAETAFRALFEIDGQPDLSGPVTPAQSTTTLSHFVALAAR
jgi:HK97 family phage major capsid protein